MADDARERPPLGLGGLLLLMLAAWFLISLLFGGQGRVSVSYSWFLREVESGNVAAVTLVGREVQGRLAEPVPLSVLFDKASNESPEDGAGAKQDAEEGEEPKGGLLGLLERLFGGEDEERIFERFTTRVPEVGDPELVPLLKRKGVDIEVREPVDMSWIWYVLLLGLPLLIFLRLMRSQTGGVGRMFGMGKSRAKRFEKTRESVDFDDVAGCEGAKTELAEIVAFLKDPGRLRSFGGKVPKGVLLVGAPGTGKTLLARAVAGEAGVPFFSVTGSDFVEMFVGVGASRVRDLFEMAKKEPSAIVFVDELDSVGRRRGAGLGGGHDEREQTLNQLLSELDGFEPADNVVVIAATNRPDILDPALLRPGRFDRRVTVHLPTRSDRLEILKIHAANKPLAEDVDLERLAGATTGFSGADLENLLNEAALLAARTTHDDIRTEDVEAARDKVLLGLERTGLMLSDEERRMVAYHEAGHAVVAAALPHADPVHKVSIVPRDQSMGVTQQMPERDKYIYPREYMLDRLAVMMGGRAAEELVLDTATSGAGNDLQEAARLARRMVFEWGMGSRTGHMALGGPQEVFLGEQLAGRREFSEETAHQADLDVADILAEAYGRARQVLERRREALDHVVEMLLDEEEVLGERVTELLRGAEAQ